MKRRKLTLKTETIRTLQPGELGQAGGGSGGAGGSGCCVYSGGCTVGLVSIEGRCGIGIFPITISISINPVP